MSKILAILLLSSIVFTTSVKAATKTLAYQQGFSNQYNQGFSDGYNSLDVTLGKHTQDYLAGYKAAVSSSTTTDM
jgi:branched-subunit amino acid permease